MRFAEAQMSASGADERSPDLFALGRQASAEVQAVAGGRGIFGRTRQLLGSGAWKGPRDAAEAYVEEEDLPALGGLDAARAAGVRTLVATTTAQARAAAAAGLRVLLRIPYRTGEPAGDRQARLQAVAELAAELDGNPDSNLDESSGGSGRMDGVLPTPEGEPGGLDTLMMMASCRRELPVAHVIADFVRLGHRLAQMSLGFGADELFGPIMPERALRLGANANNPIMTRKEAAILIRGAGLRPCERLSGGTLEEVEA
jgi:hypothetical protein